MKKQTIGLMMVVRNELNRIKDCLDWHLPYVDEVAICDQMSDDGTYALLQTYLENQKIPFTLIRDKVHGYCEPSKQKTADLLNTDWILYLDPDEKFPKVFLEDMHHLVKTEDYDGFSFPRYNFFDVQVFDDNVPIEPKWLTVQHPAKDPQLRLTRKSVSKFPEFLHHRVRIFREDGSKHQWELLYPIEHHKTINEQWNDNSRYEVINKRRGE